MTDLTRSDFFVHGEGVVHKFLTKHKALVKIDAGIIQDEGECIGLLKTEKFVHRGALLNQAEDEAAHIWQFVALGSRVKFWAHPLDSQDGDDAQWFIMYGWLLEDETKLAVKYFPGLFNRECRVSEIDPTGKRKGVLTYESRQECIEISFLASKVWNYGQRLSPKSELKLQMPIESVFFCDAIPEMTADGDITWMATAVWRGAKHTPNAQENSVASGDISSLTQVIMNIMRNSKAVYVQGRGQVMKIINDELGLALLHIGLNIFETVLFHRVWVQAFDTSLATCSLQDCLQEGDPLNIICTSSSQGNVKNEHAFKWVACSVQLDLQREED